MAKGRKLTTSCSERLLGSCYNYDQRQETVVDPPELSEEGMWSMVHEVVSGGNHQLMSNTLDEWSQRSTADSNESGSIWVHRRLAPTDDRRVGGLSLALDDTSCKTALQRIVHQFRGQDNVESPCGRHNMASSAPLNVPDWSKIYRVDSVESLHDSDNDDDPEMVPPHEYLAREHRKMAANSVFEGVGRTLKGRDMSRVRDAVWNQTGFYG